jgi:hypothetical protein
VTVPDYPITFRISPIIRWTLGLLYLGLTLPLPFLAEVTDAPAAPSLLWIGIASGGFVLYGALSERVVVSDHAIAITYPRWFLFRKGWSLDWKAIKDLKMRTTGQGGLVYYFVSEGSDRAYLLPMRIAGFARLVEIITEKTKINTLDICPLAQPWMYLILLGLSLSLLLVDAWTIATARSLGVG